MTRTKIWSAVVLMSVAAATGMAQEKGTWRPMSKTAQAITGPVSFGNEKLTMNFLNFPIAEIRQLTPAEMGSPFEGEAPAGSVGHLYRLSIPAAQRFLHKNTMCGAEETQWMLTKVTGKELEVAFFSGATMPVLTREAVSNSTALCGTYGYTR